MNLANFIQNFWISRINSTKKLEILKKFKKIFRKFKKV